MLPYLDQHNIKELIDNNKYLIIANDIVYDVTNYYKIHPGGKCILKNVIKDSRKIVQSTIDYNFHSKLSRKIWKQLEIGTIKERSVNICVCF